MRGRKAAAEVVDRGRAKKLAAVAKRFEAFRPAREVLSRVRAVPTCFVDFDHATRVGGLPIERFSLIHGRSNEGKTLATIGFEGSFLARDHFVLHVDAERTTPITWVEGLIGQYADHPRYFAIRPDNYEQTMAEVRVFLNNVAEARREGEVDEETGALVVVDSLKKLVPRDLMKEILKAEQDASEVKGGNDRGGQLKAKMNAAWMDELVPMLERAGAGFIAVAREMQDPDAKPWAKKFGNDYKVGGGSAIYYDASLVMRVEREKFVTHGEGADAKVYGERHRLTIKKTKVAAKEGKVQVSHFHSSNGVLVPFGFDRARDVLDLALRVGVVSKSGSWYADESLGERIAAGEHNVVKVLAGNAEWLGAIEARTREKFAEVEPVEHDEETGEVA